MPDFLKKYQLLLPLLIGAILRVVHLGGRSLWVDEGLTAMLVSVPLKDTIAGCALNSNPPLYYIALWPWARIFGINEISLAAFTTLCGLITIYFVYHLAREIRDDKTAFLSAMITAISPFMVYASNDIRPYAFMGMAAIIAIYFFYKAITTNKFLFWVLTAVSNTACIYTHHLAWAIPLFQVVYVVIAKPFRSWRLLRNLALALISVLILYVPQLPITLFQIRLIRLDDFSPVGSAGGGAIKVLIVAVKQFFAGFYRILTDYYFIELWGRGLKQISGWEIPFFLLTLLLGFGLPLLILIYLIRNKPKWALFLTLMYLVPFLQVFWEGTDPRRYTPQACALFILLAMAYFTWSKLLRIIVICLFLLSSALSLKAAYSMPYSIFKREDYRGVSNIIRQNRSPSDAVIFHGGSCGCLAWQYYDPGGTIFATPNYYPYNFNIYPMIYPDEIFSPEYFPAHIDPLLKTHPQIWMVVSNSYPPNIMPLIDRWRLEYDIQVIYTDYYLTLLKIKGR